MAISRRYLYLPLVIITTFVLYWQVDLVHNLRHVILPSEKSTSTSASSITAAETITPNPTTVRASSTAVPIPTSQSTVPSYDRTLVVARLKKEDVSWIQNELPDLHTAIYVVDDPTAEFHVPKNKGHEAMAYLTFIIDHYENLPEIAIFIHSDRITWHNNDLLDSDLVKMTRRLNSERVKREGYINLRCHLQPGCSDNLHLNRTEENVHKPEENIIRGIWSELHPFDPIPATLSHPCCAQFAVSRTQIRKYPLARYVTWREWILKTELDDRLSGRIWEYTWHYIFSGKADLCPEPHLCYCDGFRVCFESKDALSEWFSLGERKKELEKEYNNWKEAGHTSENKAKAGIDEEDKVYRRRIDEMRSDLERLKREALARGDDPIARDKALGQ
ncbi:MAG: hypothetical protein Q9187_005605 [Circinaria calcarea]